MGPVLKLPYKGKDDQEGDEELRGLGLNLKSLMDAH